MAPSYKTIVERYCKAHENSWSEVTVKNAKSQLMQLPGDLQLKNDGKALYSYLKDARELRPYSIKTAFIRIGDFLDWAMEEQYLARSFNNVKLFMKHNAKLFKNVYEQRRDGLTFEETMKQLAKIKDVEAREKAFQLLRTGMRWEESFTLKNGYVVGKGNKTRFVRTATKEDEKVKYTKSYVTFYHQLQSVGLKPHDLRKAHANFLAANGAHVGDLMAMMGWSSMQSAAAYMQSHREQELASQVHKQMRKKTSGK